MMMSIAKSYEGPGMAKLRSRYSVDEFAGLCQRFSPEEERHGSWDGVSFRYYRSENVECIEHYLRPRDRDIQSNHPRPGHNPAA